MPVIPGELCDHRWVGSASRGLTSRLFICIPKLRLTFVFGTLNFLGTTAERPRTRLGSQRGEKGYISYRGCLPRGDCTHFGWALHEDNLVGNGLCLGLPPVPDVANWLALQDVGRLTICWTSHVWCSDCLICGSRIVWTLSMSLAHFARCGMPVFMYL